MTRHGIALVLITALGLSLRLYDLTAQSLWGDEAFSIYAAKCVDMHFMTASLVDATHRKFVNPAKSVRALLRAVIRNEGAPPAYYLGLAAWIKIFGSSDASVRALSALFGTLAIPFFYLLGLRLTGRRDTALLAALFIAVSPLNIYFSQEARAYIMANCAAIICSWLFVRALEKGSDWRAWAWYGAGAALLCYSFYFAALILVAHLIYLLLFARRRFLPWWAALAGAGLLFLPWCVIGLKTQLAVTGGYATPGPDTFPALMRVYFDRLRYILDSLLLGPMYSAVIINGPVKLAVELGMLALLIAGGARLWRRGRKQVVIFLLLLILVPLAIISLYGLLKETMWYMKPRYHMWEASGIVLLAAASLTTFHRKLIPWLAGGMLCVIFLLAAPYHIYPDVYNRGHSKADFRAVAEIITQEQQRGDLVIINIAGHMIPLNIYYTGGLRQVGMAETGRYDLRETVERYTRKRERVWLLIGLDTVGHGDEVLTDYLNERYSSMQVYEERKLRLTRYSRSNGSTTRQRGQSQKFNEKFGHRVIASPTKWGAAISVR